MPRFLHCGCSARASRWVPAGHAGDGHADQLARGERHRAGCCSLSASTTSLRVGGRHGRPGEIDQAHDLLHRARGSRGRARGPQLVVTRPSSQGRSDVWPTGSALCGELVSNARRPWPLAGVFAVSGVYACVVGCDGPTSLSAPLRALRRRLRPKRRDRRRRGRSHPWAPHGVLTHRGGAIDPQRGQLLEQHASCAVLQRHSQLGGARTVTPIGRVGRDGLEMTQRARTVAADFAPSRPIREPSALSPTRANSRGWSRVRRRTGDDAALVDQRFLRRSSWTTLILGRTARGPCPACR